MTLERLNDELLVRLPLNMDFAELQSLLDSFRYKEIVSKSKATDEDIAAILGEAADERRKWWGSHRQQLLQTAEYEYSC